MTVSTGKFLQCSFYREVPTGKFLHDSFYREVLTGQFLRGTFYREVSLRISCKLIPTFIVLNTQHTCCGA